MNQDELKWDDQEQEVPLAPKPKKKKRKAAPKAIADPEDPSVVQLRERCRFYCKDIHQWRVVCKYNRAKLEEFLADNDFQTSAENSDNLTEVCAQMYAWFLDKVTKADGHVSEEVLADVSLHDCIHKELVDIMQFVTNRAKFLVYSLNDVFQGKKRQLAIRDDGTFVANGPGSMESRESPFAEQDGGACEQQGIAPCPSPRRRSR